MSSIQIQKISITKLTTDAIVNAANEGLWAGGGVCGAIFEAAGREKLAEACSAIGGCKTGDAVITPGFQLSAKYVIHAVGPVWHGGDRREPQYLYSAYQHSLLVAKENGCHSIGFPLISAGIFGYPLKPAWQAALSACKDFLKENPEYEMEIVFAVIDDEVKAVGERLCAECLIVQGARQTGKTYVVERYAEAHCEEFSGN
ncbi:O-acetyl-ADP-ribose deacetylase (regulator of RNase III), contains Macro domain [Lachnospiraceae bacterium XBB1006]|nr:O-acetyl-ADP-ribose deacetylase (regulator of RNase III), contains Macro domain [Lachnospiraceae bacterium XBB1006]